MDELAEYFQALLNYAANNAQNLNAESQQALAQLIQQFMELIESQLNQPTENVPETPELNPSMPSSNVSEFAYDDKNKKLYVRFLGKYPNRMGPVYSYDGVPPVIFDLFRKGAVPARTDGKNKWGEWWRGKVPSAGASLFTLIKTQGYPYQRLS